MKYTLAFAVFVAAIALARTQFMRDEDEPPKFNAYVDKADHIFKWCNSNADCGTASQYCHHWCAKWTLNWLCHDYCVDYKYEYTDPVTNKTEYANYKMSSVWGYNMGYAK